jgi:hypothetical protein
MPSYIRIPHKCSTCSSALNKRFPITSKCDLTFNLKIKRFTLVIIIMSICVHPSINKFHTASQGWTFVLSYIEISMCSAMCFSWPVCMTLTFDLETCFMREHLYEDSFIFFHACRRYAQGKNWTPPAQPLAGGGGGGYYTTCFSTYMYIK